MLVVSIESVETNHTQCSTDVPVRLWEPQATEIELP